MYNTTMYKKGEDKAVIFDMDGTIWDSAEQVTEAWLEVCRKFGLEDVITKKNIQDCMGMVMNDIFDKLLPDRDEAFRRKVQYCCESHENEYLRTHCGIVYEGLGPCLEKLRAMGLKTLIVTNAQDGYVQSFLASSGMGDLFDDYEMYGRTMLLKAENIRLIMERNGIREAIYVGDTQLDYESAEACGCHFVHAAYGFGQAPAARYRIMSPAELPDIAAGIFK